MKKIIHLSDIHIGHPGLKDRFNTLITHMIETLKPANDYVVLITGDLVNNANMEGVYDKANVCLDRLKEAGFYVLPVPGNHDYGTGSLGNAKYVPLYKKAFYKTEEVTYPKLDIIDGIAFVGLDSMAEELHWYDRLWAEGELGKKQLKRLSDMLSSDAVKVCDYTVVYLHHHPFHPRPFHHLKDSKAFQKTLAPYHIDALLFGHNHDGNVYNGTWDIPRVYDAGSSTGKRSTIGFHRIICLDTDPMEDRDAQFLK